MWYERRQNRYSLVTLEHVIRTQTKQVFIDDIGSPYHMFQCHQWIPVLSAFVSHVPMSSINTCFVCVRITCSNFTSKYLFCLRSYRMFQFQQWIPVLSAMWYGRRQNRYSLLKLKHVIRTQTKQVFTGEIGTCDTDADKKDIYWWHLNMWYGRRQNRYSLVKLEVRITCSNVTNKYLFCLRPYHMLQFHQWIPVLSASVSHVPMLAVNTCFVCHVIRTQTKQVFTGEIGTCDTDADKTGIYWWHLNIWYGRRQNRYSLLKLKHVIRTQTKLVFNGEIGACDTDADKTGIHCWNWNMWYGRRQNRYVLVTFEHVIRTQTRKIFIVEIETCDKNADKTGIYWWNWNMWYGRRQNRYLLVKLEHVIRTQTKQVFTGSIGTCRTDADKTGIYW